jgi:predicted ATPase/DNA-binding CsgD family transcriptional regulator
MAGVISLEGAGGQRKAGRLPAEVTGFVGRKEELARIGVLLESARLVTVTGPGGVGKTRVAARAAAQAADGYRDGVFLAELSGLRDPELLADAVAACLGVPAQDGRSQREAVLAWLRARQLLLILDTCEHVIDACAALAGAVLREAPGVTILATSRQPLDAPGEHVLALAPLPVHDRGAVPGTAPAGGGDAVELFAQRAASAVPGFEVTAASWADAARLCRRLDGIPLAIELAAIRLRALPLRELARRLDKRFDGLGSGRRGGVPRHQTLRTTIEWSYELRTPAERELWARLSVFAGTFDLDGAGEVCAGPGTGREELLATLAGLIDKSVVLFDGARYRLLDTLREFGADQLAASGQEQAIRGRHLERFLAMACSFGEHFLDDDQLARFSGLHAEHANLRAAMEYGLGSRDQRRVLDGAGLATALYGYWHVSGMMREGRYWLSMALDRLPGGPSHARAWALIVRGYLATFGADVPQAVIDTREGVAMARELGDEGLLAARACLYLQMALMFASRHEEAFAAAEQARQRLEALGDRIGLLCLDAQMGHLYELAGQPAAAVEACEQGLRRLGESDERWIQSYYHLVAGCALFFMGGREAESVAAVSRALRVKHELGDIAGCGYALEILAWTAAANGRAARAAWLLGGADPLWEQAGGRLGGNPIMDQYHHDAVKRARGDLGDQRFRALFTRGAAHDPGHLVRRALADADDLRAPATSRPAALTAREKQIAALAAGGLTNQQIATRLFIAKRTVDAHLEHIYGKLGITSRVQLTVQVLEKAPAPQDPGPGPGQ